MTESRAGGRRRGSRRLRGLRRTFPVVIACLLGALLAASSCGTPPKEEGGGHNRPNIINIMTDDQPVEMMQVMKHTQHRFYDQGVRFSRYYASTPLCCPSRSTFLSGQYSHNNGVRHNRAPLGGYDKLDDKNTLPVWLQRSGYVTSHIGKYPNGYGLKNPRDVPPGYDEWRGSTDPQTYNMWGYRLNENGRLHTYGNPVDEDPHLYQTDVYRDKAVDFINRRSGQNKPFYLDVAFLAPHAENTKVTMTGDQHPNWPPVGPAPRPAPRHKGKLADLKLPQNPAFNERDMSDKPAFLRNQPRLDKTTIDKIAKSYRGRAAAMLAVDEAVETIIDTLKKRGELDNTYLVFSSDNGFFFGEHRVSTGKYLPHDASSHVPLMIRGPGIKGGRVSNELVDNADLTATLAGIGGARPTHPLDGRSFLPFAKNPSAHTNRPILHEGGDGALLDNVTARHRNVPKDDLSAGAMAGRGDFDQDGPASPPVRKRPRPPGYSLSVNYEAIRTDRYLYIRYGDGERELYDLRRDPYELQSRQRDPRYRNTMNYLDGQLNVLQKCRGAACSKELPPNR